MFFQNKNSFTMSFQKKYTKNHVSRGAAAATQKYLIKNFVLTSFHKNNTKNYVSRGAALATQKYLIKNYQYKTN